MFTNLDDTTTSHQSKSTNIVSFLQQQQDRLGDDDNNNKTKPIFTSKETIEMQRNRDKKNTVSNISSKHVKWTEEELALLLSSSQDALNGGGSNENVVILDEVKVAEILLRQELRKNQKTLLFQKN